MFRFVIRLLVFAFVIGLSLFVGAQWKINSDLERLSTRLLPNTKIIYKSAVMNWRGELVIRNISFPLVQHNSPLNIEKLTVSTRAFWQLAFLNRLWRDKVLLDDVTIKIHKLSIPLTPDNIKTLQGYHQPNQFEKLLALGCGNVKFFGINEYFSMGYDFLRASSQITFEKDSYNNNLLMSGNLSVEETAQFEFDLSINQFYQWYHSRSLAVGKGVQPVDLGIERLKLVVNDKGYNQSKKAFCSLKSRKSQAQYLDEHWRILSLKLQEQNIFFNEDSENYYANYLKDGSSLALELLPDVNFSFNDFGYYKEKELRDLLGMKLTINGQKVPLVFDGWTLDKFDQIDTRKTIQPGAKLKRRFESVAVAKRYVRKDLATAPSFVGEKVRVKRTDGRVFVGKLNKVTSKRLHISAAMHGGVLDLSIEKRKVRSFELFQ